MSKTSADRRAGKGVIRLYPAETSLGWRVIRNVSTAEAAEKLAAGEWREVYDELGNFWGCQVLATFKKDEELPSGASSTCITVRECELNAGLRGPSRTRGMSEEQRISRHSRLGRPLAPEDAIERAIEKVREFGRRRLVASPLSANVPTQGNWDAFPDFAQIDG